MRVYSDPSREADKWSLPDVEVFYLREGEMESPDTEEGTLPAGWYWWSCFPGCMPDGDPMGPFPSEAAAIANAQDLG